MKPENNKQKFLFIFFVCVFLLALAIVWRCHNWNNTNIEQDPIQTIENKPEQGAPVSQSLANMKNHRDGNAAAPHNPALGGNGSVKGYIKWLDGKPAVNVVVRFIGPSNNEQEASVTDQAGIFVFKKINDIPKKEYSFYVQPPCWIKGECFSVGVTNQANLDIVQLAPILLPNEVDCNLEIDLSTDVLKLLNDSDYSTLFVEFTELNLPHAPSLFPKVIGSKEFGLKNGGQFRAVVRIKYVDVVTCVISADVGRVDFRELYEKRQVIGRIHVQIKRDSVQRVTFKGNVDNCLRGQVIDHIGQPLPEALIIVRPAAGTPGFSGRLNVSTAGRFFRFFETTGSKLDIEAACFGLKVKRSSYSIDEGPLTLSLDFSGYRQFQLRRGNSVIDRYRVGTFSYLFGKQDLPSLPIREDGKCWLPKWQNQEIENKFVITWKEGIEFYEFGFDFPTGDAQKLAVIDLNDYDINPCGTLEVIFGDKSNVVVFIEPVIPLSNVQCPPLVVGADKKQEKIKFYGFRVGKYTVKIDNARVWPGQPPLKVFVLDLPNGFGVIDVASYL